jgi:TPR repeat protein
MLSLGGLYRDGSGTKKDLVEALAWYQVSSLMLDPQDQDSLGFSEREARSIVSQLTDAQRQEAIGRLDVLKKFTAPQEPQKSLDEGESRI